MERYQMIIKGRVQGVGFRLYIQQLANTCTLTGYVKNLDDGNVNIHIQGSSEKLLEFESKVYKGNRFIRVDSIDKTVLKCKEKESDFKILYY